MNFFLVCVIVVSLGDDSPTQWSSNVGPFLIVLLWTALRVMWEDIRRQHGDDAENVRLYWRYDFSVKEFVEATCVLFLCRVAAGSPSICVHFECVASALCCMCTCSRLFTEARETPKPCPLERQSTSGAFFNGQKYFQSESFWSLVAAQNKTTVESDCFHARSRICSFLCPCLVVDGSMCRSVVRSRAGERGFLEVTRRPIHKDLCIVARCRFVLCGRFRQAVTMIGGSGPRCLLLEHSHRLFQLLPGVLVWLRADTSCRPCLLFPCVFETSTYCALSRNRRM